MSLIENATETAIGYWAVFQRLDARHRLALGVALSFCAGFVYGCVEDQGEAITVDDQVGLPAHETYEWTGSGAWINGEWVASPEIPVPAEIPAPYLLPERDLKPGDVSILFGLDGRRTECRRDYENDVVCKEMVAEAVPLAELDLPFHLPGLEWGHRYRFLGPGGKRWLCEGAENGETFCRHDPIPKPTPGDGATQFWDKACRPAKHGGEICEGPVRRLIPWELGTPSGEVTPDVWIEPFVHGYAPGEWYEGPLGRQSHPYRGKRPLTGAPLGTEPEYSI